MKPKQTAVEWLAKELESYGDPEYLGLKWNTLDELVEQAKALEREQHEHTWDEALIQVDKRGGVIIRALVDFDDYWPQ
jgi:hypothetical protein